MIVRFQFEFSIFERTYISFILILPSVIKLSTTRDWKNFSEAQSYTITILPQYLYSFLTIVIFLFGDVFHLSSLVLHNNDN